MDAPEGRTAHVEHPFVGRPWWSRCEVCKLAMPAHFEVEPVTYEAMVAEIGSHPHRCPDCVKLDRFTADGVTIAHAVCSHATVLL